MALKPILSFLAIMISCCIRSQDPQPSKKLMDASGKPLDWLQGSWKGMYNNAPFYEAWHKVNDSIMVNFRIEIKGPDTAVKENGALLLTSNFRGYRSKSATWMLVSLSDERIALGNDTLKYANRIIWSHSQNDHWLTEIHNPAGTINYDMEKVPWLDPVVNRFILNARKQ
ncbi:MAG TPA: hypothetical protein VGO58_14550 [Chitinophagaceae bacterium]|jgi:hypothetical protein|nr:hypothetical protein [Chitinophagaceae bacterium]